MSLDHNSNAEDLALGGLRLAPETRLAALVSSYHLAVNERMLASARSVLEYAGLAPGSLWVVRAPGAFELPLLARALARRADLDAVLCFGLVLRGRTAHNEHVARAACDGLARVSLECDKPVLFGLLTCETLEQAEERADPARLDKGGEVARAAVACLAALDRIRARPSLRNSPFSAMLGTHYPQRTVWEKP